MFLSFLHLDMQSMLRVVFGDTKINDFDIIIDKSIIISTNAKVFRLDITMNNPFRMHKLNGSNHVLPNQATSFKIELLIMLFE